MADQATGVTLPQGYTLDAKPELPAGYTLDQGPAQPTAQSYNFPKPTYKSWLPGPLGRMDEAVQDSIDWMADGVQRMIKANTLDEKLAGLHETVSGFFNTAGAPLVLQGLGTAPVRTAAGVALGLGTQKAAENVLPALGAGPGATMAGSDIAGIAAGMYGPDVVPAVGRGVVAAAPDVAKGVGKLGVGAAMAKVPIPEALKFGAGLPLAYSGGKQVIKGFGKGFRAALTPPAGPVEAAPATPEPYTPGGPGYPSSLAPEAAPEPAPYTPEGPGYPMPEQPGAGLPALNVDQLARDRFGRNFSDLSGDQQAQVQQEYQGLQQPAFQGLFGQAQAAPPAPAGGLTLDDYARAIEKSPSDLTEADHARYQNLQNMVASSQAPPTSPRVMSPAEADQVFPDVAPSTVAAPAAPEAPTGPQGGVSVKADMTPTDAEAAFDAAKNRVTLEPLPEDVPSHYRDLQAREGTSNAIQAYLKDRRIAQYVLEKGITPEEFEAMPLEQQNQLIRESPTASGKGKHRPFEVRPEGPALRSRGRYADEGVRNIADTMRWMQQRGEGPAAAPATAR